MTRTKTIYCTFLFALLQVAPGHQLKTVASLSTQDSSLPPRSATWERQEGEPDLTKSGCSAERLDTSWAIENAPIEIRQHMLRITKTGTSYSDFVAHNLQSSPIEALALVIEYTDNQGVVIERMPVIGNTERASDAFHAPFPLERVSPLWNVPMQHGDSVRILGQSDGIITEDCPTGARVTFAAIQYADGTTKILSSPGWQLGATPRVIPFASQFPPDLVKPPVALLARVKVNASGQVIDVLSADQDQPDTLNLIRDQMKKTWKFNPALSDGSPTPSDLLVLFRVHSERTLAFPDTRRPASPVTLIEFFPDDRNPGKLEITFGGLFSGASVDLR